MNFIKLKVVLSMAPTQAEAQCERLLYFPTWPGCSTPSPSLIATQVFHSSGLGKKGKER